MPVVLILAFAASLGIHAALLFGTAIELPPVVETPPLLAELKPQPLPSRQAVAKPEAKKTTKAKAPQRQAARVASASPVLTAADSPSSVAPPGEPAVAGAAEATPANAPAAAPELAPEPAPVVEPAAPRLPPRGMIRYRVDRGDSNFAIGFAQHEWTIADGRYRLTSVAETTGLVWLFKAIRMEMESRGQITADGLRPEHFVVRRNGEPTKEKASFDWSAMTVSVADHGAQPLDAGAQDLLSFNYQLGYLAHPEEGDMLPIATGKKYEIYRLEVLGDEQIELPAGTMRTLHLRTPGTNSTELWLAYDYLLLPVKIRYVDGQGDSFVQVATKILAGDLAASADESAPR